MEEVYRGAAGALVTLFATVALACGARNDEAGVFGNGRLEADETRVAAKIAGRVESVEADEGQNVKEGQLLVGLAAPELEASLRQAEAGLAGARAAGVEAASQLRVLEHHADKARIDLERMEALAESGVSALRQVDLAENALEETLAALAAGRAQVSAAEAAIAERQAAVDGVNALLGECDVLSPLDGVVLHRLVEVGEVIQPGQPLLVLIDPDSLDLVVYVAASDLGRVRLGDSAGVVVDALPDEQFEGLVTEVAEEAEFTPRDIHMPDERTSLVYAVKIHMVGTDRRLKPGMRADAEIGPSEPRSEAS